MSQLLTNLEKNKSTVFSQEFKLKLSDSVGVDWSTLGHWLNIDKNYLDTIDQDYVKTNAKAYSMLTKWVQINENPTLEELKSAIKKMERMDLIEKIDELTMLKNKLNSDELISKYCGKISYKIGSDWSRWGRHLGLADLDNINSDHTKCFDKAENVFKKWKQINGYFSWDQLKKELIAFNRNDIVVEIEENFKVLAEREDDDDSYYCDGDHDDDVDDDGNDNRDDYVDHNDDFIYILSPELSSMSSNGPLSTLDLSSMSAELKKYYLRCYGEISELQPPLQASTNVDLMHQFVDLCIVDAAKTQMDAVFSVERKRFLEKQMSYSPIPYSKVFMQEKSVILISGIAGIGKTWLLRKCLLDWSNDLIWKNVKLVFYLECRRINQYENISNINDLLSVFYKNIISNFNISNHTTLFIIDGLDEFKFFNELSNLGLKCNYPIVKVLAVIQKYKHVVAGRVYAIDQYQSMYTDCNDKLTIQIMGFNEKGITKYVENHVSEENKENVKATLNNSPIAKAMASVPFYLSSMCKIISDSKTINTNSFLTMTDLYANIFLYFLRKHIKKNNKMIYQIMENDSDKKYVLNICKIAFELLVENKVIFSKEEFQTFVSDFDKNEGNFFGFIEKIETDLGCYYQFAHLTIMEFCASVYAYNCLSCDEIMANKKLKSCLSMICGLTNKSQNSLLKFLVNLNPSKKCCEESSLLSSILDKIKDLKTSQEDVDFLNNQEGT
ncbi:NACHT, LRR and PYD domains-containing protein 6-like [Hydra vulgaris]|uniref:NACHT, LRR and PYD domains-containing protein 6-like n=1 Tax=Hydra vulgaris TaxID=6087 RepID=A0ABM4B152_HYDVU